MDCLDLDQRRNIRNLALVAVGRTAIRDRAGVSKSAAKAAALIQINAQTMALTRP